ncbi:MAG: hypothetical protein NZ658_00930 [Pirellulales bacterium]|nr:hypothetical protein [Pirellulales bacterium]
MPSVCLGWSSFLAGQANFFQHGADSRSWNRQATEIRRATAWRLTGIKTDHAARSVEKDAARRAAWFDQFIDKVTGLTGSRNCENEPPSIASNPLLMPSILLIARRHDQNL